MKRGVRGQQMKRQSTVRLQDSHNLPKRPQVAAREAGSLDAKFSSQAIGTLMHAEAKRSLREDVEMSHEVSLLKIQNMSRLRALLHSPGITPGLKK